MRADPTRTRRSRAPLALALAFVVVGAAILAAAGSALASPSRYVLLKCDPELPGGGVEGATFHGSPPFTGAQNCADPKGSMFVVQQGDTTTGFAYWSLPLPPPPGGFVETVTVTGSMCNGTYQDAGTVAYAVQGGWALNCQTQTHTFAINSPTGSPGLIYLGCEGSCVGAPEAWAASFAAVEVDPVAPKVTALNGSLVTDNPIRGHQTLSALAEDEGGGVANLALRINGQPLGAGQPTACSIVWVANPSYVGVVATRPTPCPPKAEAAWTVNTAAYPFQEGVNTVSVCAQDFSTSGQPNEGCAGHTVVVDNSCPESPQTRAESVNVAFAGTQATTRTVRYRKGARVAGILLGNGGNPLSGGTICVAAETEGSTAGYVPLTTVTTDAEGKFEYVVPPGPNRQLRFAQRHDSAQIEATVTLDTHARPTLRARPHHLRNGQRVKLGGRLPEPAAAGRVVILQAAVPGSRRWITFRKATTGRRGRYKANYHFTSTTRKITYRFRALVPHQTGYPWEQGASRPVSVVVNRRRGAAHRARN
jgi:hypothetical protein